MTTTKFKTIFAVPTPFDRSPSLGICQPALKDHLQALQAAGVKSILANGTTGEFPSLTIAERKMVLECCRSNFRGEVLNNITACCVSDCLELLAHARQIADAVVILPPFYFAPVPSEGLKHFLFAVLKEAEIASYLYNFPKYTQLTISPELLQTLAVEISSLRGIKDSDPNVKSTVALKTSNPRLQVLSGKDDSLLEIYSANLDGVVAGGFNAFPELLCRISGEVIDGRTENALALQRLVGRWKQFRATASLGSIAAAKLGISTRIPGYPCYVRPPLLAAAQGLEGEAAEIVTSLLDDLRRILSS
jgi:dihydrodipicolinate synthase/N-acetylneuraminate lyase